MDSASRSIRELAGERIAEVAGLAVGLGIGIVLVLGIAALAFIATGQAVTAGVQDGLIVGLGLALVGGVTWASRRRA